jgi:hypothetical protein
LQSPIWALKVLPGNAARSRCHLHQQCYAQRPPLPALCGDWRALDPEQRSAVSCLLADWSAAVLAMGLAGIHRLEQCMTTVCLSACLLDCLSACLLISSGNFYRTDTPAGVGAPKHASTAGGFINGNNSRHMLQAQWQQGRMRHVGYGRMVDSKVLMWEVKW